MIQHFVQVVPVSWLLERFNIVRPLSCPSSGGIDPVQNNNKLITRVNQKVKKKKREIIKEYTFSKVNSKLYTEKNIWFNLQAQFRIKISIWEMFEKGKIADQHNNKKSKLLNNKINIQP